MKFALTGVYYLECLIELLIAIVELEPSVCKTPHIVVFLGAYSATRSMSGTKIVCIQFVGPQPLGDQICPECKGVI